MLVKTRPKQLRSRDGVLYELDTARAIDPRTNRRGVEFVGDKVAIVTQDAFDRIQGLMSGPRDE
jgi:hypothetical protein